MNRIAIAATLICGSLLGAQSRSGELWEYGRLYVIGSVGAMLWSTIDSSVVVDSGGLQRGSPPAAAQYPLPLIRAMNRVGAAGWEFVAVSQDGPDRSYIFKRRRP